MFVRSETAQPQPTLEGRPPRRGDRRPAPSWPRGCAGGDVSALTLGGGSYRRAGPAGRAEPQRRRHAPAKPRTGPWPPSSSPALRLVAEVGYGLPVGSRFVGTPRCGFPNGVFRALTGVRLAARRPPPIRTCSRSAAWKLVVRRVRVRSSARRPALQVVDGRGRRQVEIRRHPRVG